MGDRVRSKVFLASSTLVLCAACGDKAAPPRAFPPAEVGIVTVQPQTLPQSYDLTGQVEPSRRTEVRARVEGVVLERPFTEGAAVTPGQVLYRLDRVKTEAAYQSAIAHYINAKSTLVASGTAARKTRGGAAGRRQRARRARCGKSRARSGQERSRRFRRARRSRRPRRTRALRTRRARHGPGRSAHDDRRSRSGIRRVPPVVATGARLESGQALCPAPRAGRNAPSPRCARQRRFTPARRTPHIRLAVARLRDGHARVSRDIRESRPHPRCQGSS